jgi:hypothetical protein
MFSFKKRCNREPHRGFSSVLSVGRHTPTATEIRVIFRNGGRLAVRCREDSLRNFPSFVSYFLVPTVRHKERKNWVFLLCFSWYRRKHTKRERRGSSFLVFGFWLRRNIREGVFLWFFCTEKSCREFERRRASVQMKMSK